MYNNNDCTINKLTSGGSSLTGNPQPMAKKVTITDGVKQLANELNEVNRRINEVNYRLYGSCTPTSGNVCDGSGPIEDNIENIVTKILEDAETANKKLITIIDRL